jgi:hypothetical protein
MCGGRGEKRGVRTRGKERCDKVGREKEGRSRGRKEKAWAFSSANRYEGLKVEAVEAVVARCCQVPAYLTDLCRSKTRHHCWTVGVALGRI